MKKLISVLCIFAMLFSLCIVSANAAENTAEFVKDASSTDKVLVYNFVVTSKVDLTTVQLYYDMTDVVATGATIKAEKVDANTFNFNASNKSLAMTKTSVDPFSGAVTMGKITITLPETPASFKADLATKIGNRNVTNKINNGTTTLIDTFTVGNFAYTAGPSVKTITKTEDAIVNNATALKDKETDVEIGGAAGFAFTIPAGVTLDDNMIWSLTTADGKLYSEKINAGLSTLGEGSPVKVAATFVTGTHKGADAANKEITAVNGIFKAGEDFYFTDAADAKNQAAAE